MRKIGLTSRRVTASSRREMLRPIFLLDTMRASVVEYYAMGNGKSIAGAAATLPGDQAGVVEEAATQRPLHVRLRCVSLINGKMRGADRNRSEQQTRSA
jgi:hypothetical protein